MSIVLSFSSRLMYSSLISTSIYSLTILGSARNIVMFLMTSLTKLMKR